MTEEKKELDELARAKARIAELERENKALRGTRKMLLTTSAISAPPLGQPRPSIMISTTIKRPHVLGKPPMLQTHGLPKPKSAEELTSEILDRVKKRRETDAKKEAKTK